MIAVIITCEHASNDIPNQYRDYFAGAENIMASHRGLDIGAGELAQAFAKKYPRFFHAKISRLLIDLNRSMNHPEIFSEFSSKLLPTEQQHILTEYYHPYRNEVINAIDALIAKGEQVVHLSVHTFTPELKGKIRKTDIGLLYDPKRTAEKTFCKIWKESIYQQTKQYRVRYNYPYLGVANGFVTWLRKRYKADRYVGLELEVNQKYFSNEKNFKLEQLLVSTFGDTLQTFQETFWS